MASQGFDGKETLSPVAKKALFCWSIALALRHNLHRRQLHTDREEDVFMVPPARINVPNRHCLKILKSLYGLKQLAGIGVTFSEKLSDQWDIKTILS